MKGKEDRGSEEGKEILPRNFDKLSYKIVAFGFPFLTLGMITGAVWAKKAWGDYWSWDPKETWSPNYLACIPGLFTYSSCSAQDEH